MQKINSYSKYQKEIIKKISKELGPNTPFKYEKTSSNHLKVLIEGLDKPRYTACTPSDRKSSDNFMADLRCALKAAHLKRQPKVVLSKRMNAIELRRQYIENLTTICIKTVRTNIEQYVKRENLLVIKENSVNTLKPLRKSLATKIFDQTQRTNNHQQYITGADSNFVKAEILKHLNYMLPNAADYAYALKPAETMNKLSKAVNIASGNVAMSKIVAAHESVNNLSKATKRVTDLVIGDVNAMEEKLEVITQAVKKEGTKEKDEKNLDSITNKNPAENLAAMTKSQAIQNLRRLSRNEGEAMLEYIQIAMAENHQQDLQDVLNMMTSKGITLNMLSNYSGNAA